MQNKSDAQLLRDYAEAGNEAAFRELVQRHTDFIYSAALRQVNSPDLACDIAQSVFTDLARKAKPLSEKAAANSSLAGWLHRGARYAALNHLRDSRRRLANERQAMEQLLTDSESSTDWEQIRPALDEALDALNDEDREALLLRYFKNQDFRAVGLALGVSEDAAQKRASRAVDQLREFFAKRGVTVGASGLTVLISANAVQAAPAALFGQLATITFTASTISTATIAATKTIAMTTLQKTLIGTALVTAIGTGIFEANQVSELRKQNEKMRLQQESLAEQLQALQRERDELHGQVAARPTAPALRLPAPPVKFSAMPSEPVEHLQATNLFAGFQSLKNKAPNRLTPRQVESYLALHGRDAASLLAAYRTSGDAALLAEAMQAHPNDPRVALAAALQKDLSPAERRKWLETFERSDPDNALPDYLSALDSLRNGQTDQAVRELMAASEKTQLQDYSTQSVHNDEQVYLAAGYSVAEASAMSPLQLALLFASGDEKEVGDTFATFHSELPSLQYVKDLAVSLHELARSYKASGDAASAQAALQIAVTLGERYVNTAGENTRALLTGTAAQLVALYAMEPNAFYDNSGKAAQDRIAQLKQQRMALKNLYLQTAPLLGALAEQEWTGYNERVRDFGEPAALQWVMGKYGQKQ